MFMGWKRLSCIEYFSAVSVLLHVFCLIPGLAGTLKLPEDLPRRGAKECARILRLAKWNRPALKNPRYEVRVVGKSLGKSVFSPVLLKEAAIRQIEEFSGKLSRLGLPVNRYMRVFVESHPQ